jgi:NAD(P)-dependent dehydrogenase (short-subunit alcohol dehydrogenase family)
MRLEGKVAIVTGSSKGIGEGIARVFSAEGAAVVIVSRNASEGSKIRDDLNASGGNAIYVQTDVTDLNALQNLTDRTIEKFGRLDILVNNAGYHMSKSIEETTPEDWEFIQNTNLRSTFFCSKYAIPHLKKTRGNIIVVSSMCAHTGVARAAAYCASKGGQISLVKNMAIDLAQYGIRVNAIAPGWVQTPLVDEWFSRQPDPAKSRIEVEAQHPVGHISTIEECGKAALFLASDDASFITGITLDYDGGITLGY